ncbi:hypothetical protein ScPMuIL_005077 [Solemya velum]
MKPRSLLSNLCRHHVIKRWFCVKVSDVQLSGDDLKSRHLEKLYKSVMRKVPQPVVVVTTAEFDLLKKKWHKRGMTCTSFTSVSFQPPIISFCVQNPSRMHDLLLRTQHFAVHVLAKHQVKHCVFFSKPPRNNECQFQDIPHELTEEGVPIIPECSAVLQCKAHSVHTVGDHHVWYGSVCDGSLPHQVSPPLLYFIRSFRSVGDELFLQVFEDATLPIEDWTHEAHLRLAWNYIKEYGREEATPHIRLGIQKYHEQNKGKVKTIYNETITIFYIYAVADAINKTPIDATFEEFVSQNKHLMDKNLIFEYYTHKLIADIKSRERFFPPDLMSLPE